MQGRSLGFTLLEVLVAAAILLLVYGTLARTNIQALGAVGEAGRRLEASLLADSTLAKIEAQIAGGTVPDPGETEVEVSGYQVRVVVKPYDLELPPPPEGSTETPSKGSLLSSPGQGRGSSALRSVVVEVGWIEGVAQKSVSRTSFAFDLAAAQTVLEALAGVEGAETSEFEEEEEL